MSKSPHTHIFLPYAPQNSGSKKAEFNARNSHICFTLRYCRQQSSSLHNPFFCPGCFFWLFN
ncbi:hypothetical protein PanWU01x14_283060 [Parasponia andersonii]|uniref:Uncharacterized protein n=1 Tax=Parasponia andersonii TaxID=3476 RepID=A0A2P5B0L8_PARAD|nr:hypothetical protein PanWU01x14_283060 [Parasponia andersonii]